MTSRVVAHEGARASARALRAFRVALLASCAALAAVTAARAQDVPRADSVRTEPAPRPIPPATRPVDVDTSRARKVDGRAIAQTGPGNAVEPGLDTTRVTPFGAQVWVEIGFGGLVAPADVKSNFSAGYAGTATARWQPRDRFEWLANAGFQSLPRTEIVVISGGAQALSFRLGGNGSCYSAAVGPGVRLWKRLWLETGAGFAQFAVGPGEESLGSLTEPPVMTQIRNTVGPSVRAGLAWRFPITDTQAMSVTAAWESMRAGASRRWLQQAAGRVGYRFF